MIPLTTPAVRRLLLALAEPAERLTFRLAWSRWRRQHQATAQRGHTARRARRPEALPVPQPATLAPPVRASPALTDEQWQRVQPLLPPRTGRGRRPLDERRLVTAMLWVERTGCSWRALPPHFGPRTTVYYHYRVWCKEGRWARILQALDQPDEYQAVA